eukprot:GHVN01066871.1.p1 GENE.GHVN01066871.1~~GHVN01066871.1.p1  ORF type:complete len:661 (+),score=109.68 GHVN01066871.1:4851-6833(+)
MDDYAYTVSAARQFSCDAQTGFDGKEDKFDTFRFFTSILFSLSWWSPFDQHQLSSLLCETYYRDEFLPSGGFLSSGGAPVRKNLKRRQDFLASLYIKSNTMTCPDERPSIATTGIEPKGISFTDSAEEFIFPLKCGWALKQSRYRHKWRKRWLKLCAVQSHTLSNHNVPLTQRKAGAMRPRLVLLALRRRPSRGDVNISDEISEVFVLDHRWAAAVSSLVITTDEDEMGVNREGVSRDTVRVVSLCNTVVKFAPIKVDLPKVKSKLSPRVVSRDSGKSDVPLLNHHHKTAFDWGGLINIFNLAALYDDCTSLPSLASANSLTSPMAVESVPGDERAALVSGSPSAHSYMCESRPEEDSSNSKGVCMSPSPDLPVNEIDEIGKFTPHTSTPPHPSPRSPSSSVPTSPHTPISPLPLSSPEVCPHAIVYPLPGGSYTAANGSVVCVQHLITSPPQSDVFASLSTSMTSTTDECESSSSSARRGEGGSIRDHPGGRHHCGRYKPAQSRAETHRSPISDAYSTQSSVAGDPCWSREVSETEMVKGLPLRWTPTSPSMEWLHPYTSPLSLEGAHGTSAGIYYFCLAVSSPHPRRCDSLYHLSRVPLMGQVESRLKVKRPKPVGGGGPGQIIDGLGVHPIITHHAWLTKRQEPPDKMLRVIVGSGL